MSLGLALVAGAIEAGVGYPDALYRAIGHPVTWIGRLIAWADNRWNSDEETGPQQRLRGIMLVATLVVLSLLGGLLVARLFFLLLPPLLALIPIALLASSLLAQRSLHDHVEAVADALVKSVEQGRETVAMIVGRDTKELDEAGVCRAAIESLAESFCDGIAAPIFWIAVAGLPGGIAYKAINTADSMIGHKTSRYIDFGWAAARTDDVATWPAARLAALWLALGAFFVPGASPRRALAIAWRDAAKHDSPNAGWPEAAMAGALGLRLMGPRRYEGELADHDWMGDGRFALKAADIRTALQLYRAACSVQLGVLAILFAFTFL
ncbi:MAG: cobalamin biosynthesis protein CobD [Alphaproteobacteria bacterium]|nr:MAG: cobalamin biosynthesis protein CobD [Alphaproteobacteria bacterium]